MRNPVPTSRELEAFAAVCRYGCDKEAAASLGVSRHTVRGHVASLYVKLGAGSRLEAAMLLGWLVIPYTPSADSATSGVAVGG
jgi:DNA-binding NarL/FixJ family response regulator